MHPDSLVAVRGRERVVLSSRSERLIRLRPLTGFADDEAAIYSRAEQATPRPPAFRAPTFGRSGDFGGLLTLFDATRFLLRAGAARFRALGQISIAPRPCQLVPLILALRLGCVRLLIADDVGGGKTIEAGLVARELLDRGLARRPAVLCPVR